MQLLLIAGFLGSGKTTLTIQLAQAAIDAGKRVAILVNEIGEIGIDNDLMRRLDFDVWEMVNGCICCTLAADLVVTLHKLDAEYDVDLVILEPSGAAEPGSILSTLCYYKGRPLSGVKTITLVDPLRIVELYEVLTPLITNQIVNADCVAINKVDVASEQEIAAARLVIEKIAPDARVVTLSAKHSLEVTLLSEWLP